LFEEMAEKFWQKKLRALILLALVNAMWGSTDVAAKFAVAELSPAQLAWTRFTIALLFFCPALIARRNELPRRMVDYLPFAALGACGFFLNFVLHYEGLSLSTASHATALRVTEALGIMLLSVLILRERVGPRAILGLVAGLCGVLLVLEVDFSELSLFASGYRLGDLLILCGILVESLYTIIGKKVLSSARPLTATALGCLFGWLMLSCFYAPEVAALAASPPSAGALLACAYLGLAASGLGYWLWYVVLSGKDSHRVGVTLMIQPAVGIPLAAVFFGDDITPLFLAGAALIMAGVYFAVSGSEEGSRSPREASG